MKSKEELKQLKTEYEDLNKKLSELSQEELKEVVGGIFMKNNASNKDNKNDAFIKSQGDGGIPHEYPIYYDI